MSCRFLLVALLTGCAATPATTLEPRPITSAAEIEERVHLLVNRYRAAVAFPELALDPVLSELAREHSAAMAAGEVPFGHGGFERRAQTARAALGTAAVSENVAVNNYSPGAVATEVVEGWIDSPEHLRNLRGAFHWTGVGVVLAEDGYYYVTQLYAGR